MSVVLYFVLSCAFRDLPFADSREHGLKPTRNLAAYVRRPRGTAALKENTKAAAGNILLLSRHESARAIASAHLIGDIDRAWK